MAFHWTFLLLVISQLARGYADECQQQQYINCPTSHPLICPQEIFRGSNIKKCVQDSDCPCPSVCCSFGNNCATQCVIPFVIRNNNYQANTGSHVDSIALKQFDRRGALTFNQIERKARSSSNVNDIAVSEADNPNQNQNTFLKSNYKHHDNPKSNNNYDSTIPTFQKQTTTVGLLNEDDVPLEFFESQELDEITSEDLLNLILDIAVESFNDYEREISAKNVSATKETFISTSVTPIKSIKSEQPSTHSTHLEPRSGNINQIPSKQISPTIYPRIFNSLSFKDSDKKNKLSFSTTPSEFNKHNKNVEEPQSAIGENVTPEPNPVPKYPTHILNTVVKKHLTNRPKSFPIPTAALKKIDKDSKDKQLKMYNTTPVPRFRSPFVSIYPSKILSKLANQTAAKISGKAKGSSLSKIQKNRFADIKNTSPTSTTPIPENKSISIPSEKNNDEKENLIKLLNLVKTNDSTKQNDPKIEISIKALSAGNSSTKNGVRYICVPISESEVISQIISSLDQTLHPRSGIGNTTPISTSQSTTENTKLDKDEKELNVSTGIPFEKSQAAPNSTNGIHDFVNGLEKLAKSGEYKALIQKFLRQKEKEQKPQPHKTQTGISDEDDIITPFSKPEILQIPETFSTSNYSLIKPPEDTKNSSSIKDAAQIKDHLYKMISKSLHKYLKSRSVTIKPSKQNELQIEPPSDNALHFSQNNKTRLETPTKPEENSTGAIKNGRVEKQSSEPLMVNSSDDVSHQNIKKPKNQPNLWRSGISTDEVINTESKSSSATNETELLTIDRNTTFDKTLNSSTELKNSSDFLNSSTISLELNNVSASNTSTANNSFSENIIRRSSLNNESLVNSTLLVSGWEEFDVQQSNITSNKTFLNVGLAKEVEFNTSEVIIENATKGENFEVTTENKTQAEMFDKNATVSIIQKNSVNSSNLIVSVDNSTSLVESLDKVSNVSEIIAISNSTSKNETLIAEVANEESKINNNTIFSKTNASDTELTGHRFPYTTEQKVFDPKLEDDVQPKIENKKE